MVVSRVEVVEANLDRAVEDRGTAVDRLSDDAPLVPGSTLTAAAARRLFEDQMRSRALDVVARELKAEGRGYYTISSAGHEMNAVLGAQLRPTDPCVLHYRSGALMMARSRHAPDRDPVRDTLLSMVAAAEDPVAEGRHKVWGSRDLWVPPQTSTIASHLPKAVGLAFSLERARRLDIPAPLPVDAIVCCSFGDASANHATALSAINAARWARRRGAAVPIVFVCEDNGLGISVETPPRWIRETFGGLRHLAYVHATGEVDEVWDGVTAALRRCREERGPVFLHLDTVRLWGHAGSDVEQGYRTLDRIRADEERDPVARTARRLIDLGAATPAELRDIVTSTREHARRLAADVAGAPTLAGREEVTGPLAPFRPDAVRADAARTVDVDRRAAFGRELPEDATVAQRRTLASHLNAALRDEMLRRPEMLLFGEDVARKGGVYGVTGGLADTFGSGRVFDTLLDETTILGVAQGAGLLGQLPVPEIQYLAYLHNALDQLRGEAASTSFFSSGAFRSPMVVRVAAFAYQKGFGGHFHNDNSIGALRDIPGLAIAAPARGDDAVRMLRGALAMAAVDGRVVTLLEPIALYHERDLLEDGDGGWLTDYPPPGDVLLPGEVGVHGADDPDVTVLTYANGLRMSLRAAARLVADGIAVRVVDLRWLAPLPWEAIVDEAGRTDRLLVADECRATGGGVADAVIARLAEDGFAGRLGSVRSADSYVPLGPAADLVLLSEHDIEAAARGLLEA